VAIDDFGLPLFGNNTPFVDMGAMDSDATYVGLSPSVTQGFNWQDPSSTISFGGKTFANPYEYASAGGVAGTPEQYEGWNRYGEGEGSFFARANQQNNGGLVGLLGPDGVEGRPYLSAPEGQRFLGPIIKNNPELWKLLEPYARDKGSYDEATGYTIPEDIYKAATSAMGLWTTKGDWKGPARVISLIASAFGGALASPALSAADTAGLAAMGAEAGLSGAALDSFVNAGGMLAPGGGVAANGAVDWSSADLLKGFGKSFLPVGQKIAGESGNTLLSNIFRLGGSLTGGTGASLLKGFSGIDDSSGGDFTEGFNGGGGPELDDELDPAALWNKLQTNGSSPMYDDGFDPGDTGGLFGPAEGTGYEGLGYGPNDVGDDYIDSSSAPGFNLGAPGGRVGMLQGMADRGGNMNAVRLLNQILGGGKNGLGGQIGAAGSVGSGLYGMYQASQLRKKANEQDAMGPYRGGYAAQLAELMRNPNKIKSTPGYQFQLDEGLQALARKGAQGGYTGSGNMGIALQKYGQDYASNFLQKQLDRLAGLAGGSNPAVLQGNALANNMLSQSLASLGYGAARFAGLEDIPAWMS